jgi:hypothetical protein
MGGGFGQKVEAPDLSPRPQDQSKPLKNMHLTAKDRLT